MLIIVYIITVKNKVCKSKYLEVLEKALFNSKKINIPPPPPTDNTERYSLYFE